MTMPDEEWPNGTFGLWEESCGQDTVIDFVDAKKGCQGEHYFFASVVVGPIYAGR
jgi:hypothetical protein